MRNTLIIPNRWVISVAVDIKVNVWLRGSLRAVSMLCSLVYLLSLVAPRLTPIALIMTRERTFIAVKPDGVQRGLIGEIIKRFEVKGFKLCGMKLMQASKEHLEKHYADLSDKPFFPGLVKYMSSGPVCAMVWEGTGIVKTARNMMGETRPADSKPGSIRGDFCIEVGRNVIHGSDSIESANKEINLWFKPEELVSWTQAADSWIFEQMDIFGDPSTSWGVDLLNDFLKDRSYIRGFTPSVADSNVFASLATRPSPSFPHALRWYNHIKSLGIEMEVWVNKSESTLTKLSTKSEKEAQNYKDNYRNALKDKKEECLGKDNKEEYVGQDIKEKYAGQDTKEMYVQQDIKENFVGQDIKENYVGHNMENYVGQDIMGVNQDDDDDDDDDIDLFGSDDDSDETERIRQKCLAACAEKAKKPGPIAKSSVVLDIKPWSDETNMSEMEQHVRSISMNGLHWGASRLAPLAFGISKLSLLCTVEDEQVSVDDLIEKICELEDYVQSVDIQAFNKI